MRQLIRTPLTWLVIAEFIVVGTLVVLVWGAVAAVANPAVASPVIPPPPAAADAGQSPLPDLPAGSKPGHGPLPGLNMDPYFWRVRLVELNREQVYLEQLEWQVVHSAMDTMRHYLDTVVVPSIQRAEHAGGGALSA